MRGSCADKNIRCKVDSECKVIPKIFQKDYEKCVKIASFSKKQIKGCEV